MLCLWYHCSREYYWSLTYSTILNFMVVLNIICHDILKLIVIFVTIHVGLRPMCIFVFIFSQTCLAPRNGVSWIYGIFTLKENAGHFSCHLFYVGTSSPPCAFLQHGILMCVIGTYLRCVIHFHKHFFWIIFKNIFAKNMCINICLSKSNLHWYFSSPPCRAWIIICWNCQLCLQS